MRWPLVLVFLVAAPLAFAQEPLLAARVISVPPFVIAAIEPMSFDLLDFRTGERVMTTNRPEIDRHSAFDIKKHIGAAAGWDNGNLHTSVGLYVTVAEWGRWNFGAPTVEFGLGRYSFYDEKHRRPATSSTWTVLISLASVHYRLGYLKPWGVHWYLNLEQIVDMHSNLSGSQFGLSFSRK